jgi:hypothetical protein
MYEYAFKTVPVLTPNPDINLVLKSYLSEGWTIHSWQYVTGTRQEIAFLLMRPLPVPEPVEEKPGRKFIGMKNRDAI